MQVGEPPNGGVASAAPAGSGGSGAAMRPAASSASPGVGSATGSGKNPCGAGGYESVATGKSTAGSTIARPTPSRRLREPFLQLREHLRLRRAGRALRQDFLAADRERRRHHEADGVEDDCVRRRERTDQRACPTVPFRSSSYPESSCVERARSRKSAMMVARRSSARARSWSGLSTTRTSSAS